MKTIGLIGGMSWESTASYYKLINELSKQKYGGFHSAKIVMYSLDFDEIEKLQRANDWPKMATILADAAGRVEQAGADLVILCTNTMHKIAGDIESAIKVPLLHIADATGTRLTEHEIKTVGLLGTGFTMREEFYKGRLSDRFNLDVLTPSEADMDIIHGVIYEELCLGVFNPDSKREYLRIVEALHQRGAEAIILGCTEIGLLIQQNDTDVALFDTTQIHAEQAVELASK